MVIRWHRHRIWFALPVAAALAVVLSVILNGAGSVVRSQPPAAPKADRPQTVKVAAIQCSSGLGDAEANRKKLTALIKEAAGEGAKIIVLPETAITGYLSQDL